MSAKISVDDFLRINLVSIAERTFGEVFRQLASGRNMSARYQNSLFIKLEGDELVMELQYEGSEGEPLGVWFEQGTLDHFIAPKNPDEGPKVLSWIEDGNRFFSAGHFVTGIKATFIMLDMTTLGLPVFEAELIKRIEAEIP